MKSLQTNLYRQCALHITLAKGQFVKGSFINCVDRKGQVCSQKRQNVVNLVCQRP